MRNHKGSRQRHGQMDNTSGRLRSALAGRDAGRGLSFALSTESRNTPERTISNCESKSYQSPSVQVENGDSRNGLPADGGTVVTQNRWGVPGDSQSSDSPSAAGQGPPSGMPGHFSAPLKPYVSTCAFCGDESGECLRLYLSSPESPPCKTCLTGKARSCVEQNVRSKTNAWWSSCDCEDGR
jgi:hypothetical protein